MCFQLKRTLLQLYSSVTELLGYEINIYTNAPEFIAASVIDCLLK